MTWINGKPVAVIKVGGDMLLEQTDRDALSNNVRDLLKASWQCVVLHGGGPQLNALQERLGLAPHKVAGRRITSEQDLKVVKQALCGEVNVDLVASLIAHDVPAFGCHGASGLLIKASKRPPVKLPSMGHEPIDFGEVGDVAEINTGLLAELLKIGLVPVIASLGVSQQGRVFNINADTTVAAIARAIKAEVLILSTKVGGIYTDINDPITRIAEVTPQLATKLIKEGVITDGMIPKVEEGLALLNQGVTSVVVCNAAKDNSFLNIITAKGEMGTRLVLS